MKVHNLKSLVLVTNLKNKLYTYFSLHRTKHVLVLPHYVYKNKNVY